MCSEIGHSTGRGPWESGVCGRGASQETKGLNINMSLTVDSVGESRRGRVWEFRIGQCRKPQCVLEHKGPCLASWSEQAGNNSLGVRGRGYRVWASDLLVCARKAWYSFSVFRNWLALEGTVSVIIKASGMSEDPELQGILKVRNGQSGGTCLYMHLEGRSWQISASLRPV